MASIPTVRVVHPGGFAVINETDFDPAVHVLVADGQGPTPQGAAVTIQTPAVSAPYTNGALDKAAALGVDISAVTGTGKGGRVTAEDVVAYARNSGSV